MQAVPALLAPALEAELAVRSERIRLAGSADAFTRLHAAVPEAGR
jgi:hypothetical protein